MSRTLRRPMFRGGRVSSYGTGIAAPLVPGYQSGGQIGGGIIHGLPHADGRYGFQNPIITGTDLMSMNREQALKLAERYAPSSIDPNFYSSPSFKPYIPTTVTDEDMTTETEIETPRIDDDYNYISKRAASDVSEGLDESWAVGPKVEGPEWHEDIYIDEEGKLQHKKDDTLETDIAETKLNAEQLRIQELEKLLADKKEEPPEIDAKAMVAENKALFADLLGVKKARGQDISDMLLGFAGTEGDTVMDKFQKFAATEAQRPGRRRKLEDAAGTLAIQDYIAGKRSKEQISLMKERETFKLDEQIKRLYPQADDEWLSAVRKSAGKDDSYSSSKVIKKALAGKFEETPINPDQTKKDLAEINKDQEDFKIGFTIVTLKDGTKVIIEKTATDIKIRTDLPVF